MDTRPYAVLGATGKQGGAVARALTAGGAPVRAVVRDPGSPAARRLHETGVELVRGTLEDVDALAGAFAETRGVFAMTTFGEDGTRAEVRQGRCIGAAATRAGVERLVYTSVGGAERDSGVPHFDSKREVELHLLDLGLPVSFVRPTFFMENLADSVSGEGDPAQEIIVRMPLAPGIPVQMVAVADIAAVAVSLLHGPVPEAGYAVEIAGDELTADQVAAIWTEHAGRPVRFESLPLDVLPDDGDLRAMFTWFTHLPAYRADFTETARRSPGVRDLRRWLGERGV